MPKNNNDPSRSTGFILLSKSKHRKVARHKAGAKGKVASFLIFCHKAPKIMPKIPLSNMKVIKLFRPSKSPVMKKNLISSIPMASIFATK